MGLKLKIFLIGLASYILSFTLFLSFILDFEFSKTTLNDIYLASAISLTSLIIPRFIYLYEKSKLFWEIYDFILNKIFKSKDLKTLNKIKENEFPKLRNGMVKMNHIHECEHIKVMIDLRESLIKSKNETENMK